MKSSMKIYKTISSLPGTIVSAALDTIQLFHFNGKIRNLVLVTARKHPWIQQFQKRFDLPVFCLADKTDSQVVNTSQLLLAPETLTFLKSLPQPVRILMFKPDAQTRSRLAEHNIIILGCDPGLARKLENKLNFPDISRDAQLAIPEYKIIVLNKLKEEQDVFTIFSSPFICQFAKSFSGNRTFLVSSENDWHVLKNRFHARRCRISKYISGETWTVNGCILSGGKIAHSWPFTQKTRIFNDPEKNLPDRVGSCGNSWNSDNTEMHLKILEATNSLGKALAKRGYTGFYGADILESNTSDNFELLGIEINPRITASACILTHLEMAAGIIPVSVYHLAESLGLEMMPHKPMPFEQSGGQNIYRSDEKNTDWMNRFTSEIYKINNGEFIKIRKGISADELNNSEILIWKSMNSNSSELMRVVYNGDIKFLSDVKNLNAR